MPKQNWIIKIEFARWTLQWCDVADVDGDFPLCWFIYNSITITHWQQKDILGTNTVYIQITTHVQIDKLWIVCLMKGPNTNQEPSEVISSR